MNMFLLSVIAFFFAIGVLVAIHEWGHYIVARMSGVKVLRFSIGFGKPLWLRRSGPDQTEYCVAAIPLGGYVKLLDEREGDVSPDEVHRTFNRAPISSRIAILLAGPFMNFVFAILAYWLMYSVGVPGLQPIVGAIEPTTIAGEAGLQKQDRIMVVGEQRVATWEGAVLAILDEMLDSEQIRMEVQRIDGSQANVSMNVAGKVNELTEPGRLFTGLGLQPWAPDFEPVIGEVLADGSAEAAGLRAGDRVLLADGLPLATWAEWVEFIRANPGKDVMLTIERDGRNTDMTLLIGELTAEDGSIIGRIGAGPEVADGFYDQYLSRQQYPVFEALRAGVDRTWAMSMLTVKMVSRIVTGDVSVKNISGPINIAQVAGYSASIGLSSFLNFLAVVSLSLGILNLLPIPILDGGQVVYQILEAIKGSPLSMRVQLIGQQVGIVLLIIVMGFAFYNDLSRVFS